MMKELPYIFWMFKDDLLPLSQPASTGLAFVSCHLRLGDAAESLFSVDETEPLSETTSARQKALTP